jgi:hypothetical protein
MLYEVVAPIVASRAFGSAKPRSLATADTVDRTRLFLPRTDTTAVTITEPRWRVALKTKTRPAGTPGGSMKDRRYGGGSGVGSADGGRNRPTAH